MEEEKALARIGIGELEYDKDPEYPNVLFPFRCCFVITTAGQIWDIKAKAFTCSEANIREVWNTDRKYFTKRVLD